MDEPRQGAVAVVTQTASDTVRALGEVPVLLVIVLLNLSMCFAGAWFLLTQEQYRHAERLEIVRLLQSCTGVKGGG